MVSRETDTDDLVTRKEKHDSQDLIRPLLKRGNTLIISVLTLGTMSALGTAGQVYLSVRDHNAAIAGLQTQMERQAAHCAEHGREIDDLKASAYGSENRLLQALEKTDRKIELLCARLGKSCKE